MAHSLYGLIATKYDNKHNELKSDLIYYSPNLDIVKRQIETYIIDSDCKVDYYDGSVILSFTTFYIEINICIYSDNDYVVNLKL